MTESTGTHLTDEELLAHIEGLATARVKAHVAACPACAALCRRLEGLSEALRSDLAPQLPDSLRARIMARYRHVYRPRHAILRLLTWRVPLYQVAAAAALLFVTLTLLPRGQTPPTRWHPAFAEAQSDLWGGHPPK